MDELRRKDNWSRGANNRAKASRLEEGFVRQLVNLDPSADGGLNLRAGYERVAYGENVRGAWAVAGEVVFVDGVQVLSYRPGTNEVVALGTLSSVAPLAGAVLNDQLYLSSATDSVRYGGDALKPWAVVAPDFSVEEIEGAMPPGIYKIALVSTGSDGEESGAEPKLIRISRGGLRLTTTDDRPLRVYASVANGETLFYQGVLVAGALALTSVGDATERCVTVGMRPLPACDELVAYHGVLLGRVGRYVFSTAPMTPHLCDPVSGFLQYGAEVKLLAATEGGVYIVADKTYFVQGVETSSPGQRAVLDFGAVEGSAVVLPDKRVAWFTRYGLAIGNANGEVSLPNLNDYAPDVAAEGASGVVEHAGNQMLVTTMRGVAAPNNLATGDFADLEIGDA